MTALDPSPVRVLDQRSDARLDPADAAVLLDRQTELLERTVDGAPLAEVLGGIAETLEGLVPSSSCSVLLLDRATATLRHGAAPSLPAAYCARVDGQPIGERAGSCGTAAHTGVAVVAVDVLTDDRWTDHRALATAFGLRACWSTPIRGRDGVVGTFAVYHREPHAPTPREELLVARLTHLASVAIDRDATELERRRRTRAELAQQAAEAANRAKSDFVSALAHELRTPLQAITGFTELLTTLDLDSERRAAALAHIDAAAAHILGMVDEVLDVARLEARALPLALVDVPLEPLVRAVLEMLAPLAAAQGVAVDAAPEAPAGVVVRADERRLRQVLLNIVGNALRYNHLGGTVDVSWQVRSRSADGDGPCVGITVSDSGVGIDAEQLARLFTPFDRLGRVSGDGVGLGLPLARGLVEAMGGRLQVRSRVGSGTSVEVDLPAAR